MKLSLFTICAGVAVAGVYFGNVLFSVAGVAIGGGTFCAWLGFLCYLASALSLVAYLTETRNA